MICTSASQGTAVHDSCESGVSGCCRDGVAPAGTTAGSAAQPTQGWRVARSCAVLRDRRPSQEECRGSDRCSRHRHPAVVITAMSHARVVGLGSPKARPPRTLTTTNAIAHSFSSWFGSSGSGCGAAVFGEELIDILLRLGFDLAVEVLVVPRFLGGQVIEGVVVAGQMVPNVGPGRQRGALIH